MRFFIVLLAFLLLPGTGWSIEFKPHPTAQVTESQWTAYYDEVKAAHGGSIQEFPDEKLVVFQDNVSATSYAFTQPGHPAHPAWVTRKIVQEGNDLFVQQIGYFAGVETAFATLFQQYQALNQRMIDDLKQRRRGLRP
jgi:hypothetical protein